VHYAAHTGRLKVLECLLEAEPSALLAVNGRQQSCLMLAVQVTIVTPL
jgi:hypothetical protein